MGVKFKKLSPHARVPTRATSGSACFNVYSAESVSLGPGVTKKIKLDFRMKFAKKYVFRLYPRSGLSLKPIFLGGGVIDSDYSSNISVILTNFSFWNINIEEGDRIAQMIFLKKRRLILLRLRNLMIKLTEALKVLVRQV